jgi:hypothetical protein
MLGIGLNTRPFHRFAIKGLMAIWQIKPPYFMRSYAQKDRTVGHCRGRLHREHMPKKFLRTELRYESSSSKQTHIEKIASCQQSLANTK